MKTDVDTSKVAVNRQLSFWRDAVCTNLVGVECLSRKNISMMGRFTQLSSEGFAFARLRAEPHQAVRQKSTIRNSDANFYMLFLQKTGTMRVKRQNREFIVRPGDMYFYDGATEHQLTFHDHFEHLVVRLPRKVIESRWTDLADQGSFHASSGQSVVDRVLLPIVGSAIGSNSVRELPAVALSVIDLFASRNRADEEHLTSSSDYAHLILARTEKLIEEHIDDIDLDAEKVARSFRISRRQLDRMLAQSGTSFARLLMSRRLEMAAELLDDPMRARHSVTRIALDVGFENHSFFSRKFKERYGTPPSDYRNFKLTGPASVGGH